MFRTALTSLLGQLPVRPVVLNPTARASKHSRSLISTQTPWVSISGGRTQVFQSFHSDAGSSLRAASTNTRSLSVRLQTEPVVWQLHHTCNSSVACGLLNSKFIVAETPLHLDPAWPVFCKFYFTQINLFNCIVLKVGSRFWHHSSLSFQVQICPLDELDFISFVDKCPVWSTACSTPPANFCWELTCHKPPGSSPILCDFSNISNNFPRVIRATAFLAQPVMASLTPPSTLYIFLIYLRCSRRPVIVLLDRTRNRNRVVLPLLEPDGLIQRLAPLLSSRVSLDKWHNGSVPQCLTCKTGVLLVFSPEGYCKF